MLILVRRKPDCLTPVVRRRVACQEARVLDVGAPLPSNSQRQRLDAHSRSCSAASIRLRRRCCSAFHRARYSDHCFRYILYTAPLFVIIAQHRSTFINTQRTCNCISVCRRRKLRSLPTVSCVSRRRRSLAESHTVG